MNKLTKYVTLPILVVAGTVMVVGIAVQEPSEPTAEELEQQAEREALAELRERTRGPRHACSRFIEQNMNNPASAEWIGRLDWPTTWKDDGIITVEASFRGENAFGGIVTQNMTCVMVEVEGGHRILELQ